MATLSVKKTGGTYSTITDALAAASENDIIEIQDDGVYNEQLTISVNNITIQAKDEFSPSIWFGSDYTIRLVIGVTGFKIYGHPDYPLKIKNGASSGECIRLQGSANTLDAQYIQTYDNTAQYIIRSTSAINGLVSLKNSELLGNAAFYGTFNNVLAESNTGTLNNLFYSANINGYVRKNNLIIHTSYNEDLSATYTDGMYASSNYFQCTNETAVRFFKCFYAGFHFENNTIVCTATAKNMNCFEFSNFTPYMALKNNIIVGFKYGIYTINKTGMFGDYNCLFNNVLNYGPPIGGSVYYAVTPGANDILTDPVFGEGYSIDPTSPCIDAGTDDVDYDYDIEGILRESPYDIGCYEMSYSGIYYAYQDTSQTIIVEFLDNVVENEELTTSHLNPINYSISGNIWGFNILEIEKIDTRRVKIWLRNKVVNNTEFTLTISDNIGGIGRQKIKSFDINGVLNEKVIVKNENKYSKDIEGVYFKKDGDLELLTATDTLKRLVDNTVLTITKEFVYAPTFGSTYELKSKATMSALINLKSSIENTLRTIPNVTAVEVNVLKRVDIIDVEVIVQTDIAEVKRTFDRVIEL